jgi:opacity protein-like surface antigen
VTRDGNRVTIVPRRERPAEGIKRKEAGMKKAIALAIAIGIIAASVPAEAGFGLRVRGGYTNVSYGDFNEWVDGFNAEVPSGMSTMDKIEWLPEISAEFTFTIVPTFSGGVGIGYLSGTSDYSISIGLDGYSYKHKVRSIPLTLNLYWEPSLATLQPFVFAGAGIYRTDLEFAVGLTQGGNLEGYEADLDKWGFGLQGGGGLRFTVTPMMSFELGIQGRWADISGFEGTAKSFDGEELDVYLAKDDDYFGPEDTDGTMDEGSVNLSGITFFIGMTVAF